MQTVIQGLTIDCSASVRDDPKKRDAFNALTREVFGFDFEHYARDGYWNARFRPHVLFDGGRAVANISVNPLPFTVDGREQLYVQLGTVMTAPSHRGRGLSRYLMEQVLREWEERCDMVYLFANDTVLDFYPRFGFSPVTETRFLFPCGEGGSSPLKPLRMDDSADRDRLYALAREGNPYADVRARDAADIAMFYLTSIYRDAVYELPELGTAVILRREGDHLLLIDAYGPGTTPLPALLRRLPTDGARSIELGFSPADKAGFTASPLTDGDETLFIRAKRSSLYPDRPRRFPLLTHT